MRFQMIKSVFALLVMVGFCSGATAQTDPTFGDADIHKVEFSDDFWSRSLPVNNQIIAELDVSNNEHIHAINVTATEPGSIRILLFQVETNADGGITSTDVFSSRVAHGAAAESMRLNETLLKPGKYYIGLASLKSVNAELSVSRVPAPDSTLQNGGKPKLPISVGNDLLGAVDKNRSCVKPALLSAGSSVDLTVVSTPMANLNVYLQTDAGKRVGELRRGKGIVAFTSLRGRQYSVCVTGSGDSDALWRMIVEPSAERSEFPEPNGAEGTRLMLPIGREFPVEGILDSAEIDQFAIPKAPKGKAFRLDVKSAVKTNVCLVRSKGFEECKITKSIELGPFTDMQEGYVSLTNREWKAERYSLSIRMVDFDPDRSDLEPNNQTIDAYIKDGAFTLTGDLSDDTDHDMISFDGGAEAQLWRIVVLGDNVSKLSVQNQRGPLADVKRSGAGRRLVTPDFYLEGGLAKIVVAGGKGKYRVVVKPLGEPRADSEREPNYIVPRHLGLDEKIVGVVQRDDSDKFSFYLERESPVRLSFVAPPGAEYGLSIHQGRRASLPETSRIKGVLGDWHETYFLPPGEHTIAVHASKPSPAEYELSAAIDAPLGPIVSEQVDVTFDAMPALQAFSKFGQSVDGAATYENATNRAVVFTPAVWISNPDYELKFQALEKTFDWMFFIRASDVARMQLGYIILPSGTEYELPFSLSAPSDLFDPGAQIFVGARSLDANIIGEGRTVAKADMMVDPQSPIPDYPAPIGMIGGINVALSPLGAKLVAQPDYPLDEAGNPVRGNPADARLTAQILDGFISQDHQRESYLSKASEVTYSPIVDLAGDEAIPIVGVGVGLAARAENHSIVSNFAIDVSLDGLSWLEVFSGRLEKWGTVEYFAFPSGPQAARYARLRPLRVEKGTKETITLSAFEVIATPGQSGLSQINLADPDLGALVVGEQGVKSDRYFQLKRPTDKRASEYAKVDSVSDFNRAITFKNQRLAEVSAIEFIYPDTDDYSKYPLATQAIVSVSTRGPVGPFTEISRIDLPSAPKALERVYFELPEYQSAKSIKIDYAVSSRKYFYVPAQIKVFERPDADSYRSALGLWGEFSHQKEEKWASVEDDSQTDGSGDLKLNAPYVQGRVQFQERTNNWTVESDAQDNAIRIIVEGSLGFEPQIIARDRQQKAIEPFEFIRNTSSRSTEYLFLGTDLNIEVFEQQRSVIFLADFSGSVSSYIPVLKRGMNAFANSFVDGRDAVQFKSFGGDWVDEEWITDRHTFRKSLANYVGGTNSSGETALVDASELLSNRPGSKAVVIITDVETDNAKNLVQSLNEASARVFVIKIPSRSSSGGKAKVGQPRGMMWSGVTDGEMYLVLRAQDISVAYARATARLLGPKTYRIKAQSERVVLSPGRLSVAISEDVDLKTGSSLHILLDASGSMLKQIEGRRRIAIVKSALSDLIDDVSEGEQYNAIGLRTFGGRPSMCETALVRPIDSFDSNLIKKSVQSISPQNNAKTPIAAALESVAGDLEGVRGSSEILLITDGEETCDGDPLEIIKSLKAKGINIRLDVISFALDPDVDRSAFEAWADAGGGVYVDVDDNTDLSASIQNITAPLYRVVKDDVIIATGSVGDEAMELEAGRYDIVADGFETQSVVIAPNKTANIVLRD